MNRFTLSRRPYARKRLAAVRLELELLECRTVPSSLNIVEVEPNNTSAAANPVALGFDPGEDTRVIVNGSVGTPGDDDWFRVELNAGDVISAGVRAQNGLDPTVGLWKPEGASGALTQLDFNDFSVFTGWRLLPSESPLSRLSARYTDAELYYVINAPGEYFIEVAVSPYAPPEGTTGDYHMELVVARPGLEAQPVGTKQVLYIDFDGAAVNTSDFGRGWSTAANGTARLSRLSSFLANWGLSAADEDAVIDATLATIRENLADDIRARGLNGDFASSGIPGEFAIDIRNSRDDADEFGKNPFVSRIVIGGTKEELGAFIPVAISSVIDPGNFSFDDQAVVLLDDLSAASHPFSLNQYAIDPGRTKAQLVGLGIGSIAAHEAGHFFGNFHTEVTSAQPDLMDGAPYSLDLTVGIGPDRVFGTPDDIDVDFGVDIYNYWGQFAGRQDALNTIAFGLSTGRGLGTSLTTGVAGASSSGSSDVRAFGWMEQPAPHSAGTAPALMAVAATITDPGALLSSAVSWEGLAVNAFFTALARTSLATSCVVPDNTADSHTFDLPARTVRGDTDEIDPPTAEMSGTPTFSVARRAAHARADDWATDVLTLADPAWSRELAWLVR